MEDRFRPGRYVVRADGDLKAVLHKECIRCSSANTFRNARIRYNEEYGTVEVVAIGLAEICSSCGHVVYPTSGPK